MARKASSEAGAEVLLQSQGMETRGEKVEDENSSKCTQRLDNRQESLKRGQEWRI